MDFKDGAVVRLKSGGPLLTVESTRPDRMVSVEWFDGADLQRAAFRPECIELAGSGNDSPKPAPMKWGGVGVGY